MRRYSAMDRLLMRLSQNLATKPPPADAPSALPGHNENTDAPALDPQARRLSANLMRVNHAGEVAAQGLYHGQAITAHEEPIREQLLKAADEEQAHLQWCEQRLRELDDRPSVFRPFWYGASMAMGAVAGLLGDKWSLGFVAETEAQVSEHLDQHISRLPEQDQRSRNILQAMQADEERHGREAKDSGGLPLPEFVRKTMRGVAQVMKQTAFRI